MIQEKLKFVILKIKNDILWDYFYGTLRKPKEKFLVPFKGTAYDRIKNILHNPQTQNEIIEELKKSGLNVIDLKIDVDDYRQYLKEAEYNIFQDYYGGIKSWNLSEKSLEHYLGAKLLSLSREDIYIDIANLNSPAPDIYKKLFGCKVYRQDLIYPEGIHGNIIGGDAANMPLEDCSVTKMGLHCSFEHFEKDSDLRFIKEAGRVLKRGGKLCILPLYLFNKYIIGTDPAVLPRGGIPFEDDAILYCIKGSDVRHSRFYDIPHFISRIKNNLNGLDLTIFVVKNEKEVDSSCYVKFIAIFEKK